jgi:hypothetical protein
VLLGGRGSGWASIKFKCVDIQSLLWNKTLWVLLALFAPELVVYSAATQFVKTYSFRKRIKELQASSDSADTEVRLSKSPEVGMFADHAVCF